MLTKSVEKVMNPLLLTEIWIYPIKSFGGIRQKSARVLEKGLEYDRRWMVVDSDRKFMTQREFPKMALFKTSIETDEVKIHFQGDTIGFKAGKYDGPLQQVRVFDDIVEAAEVNQSISKWISDRLETECSLVFFPEENSRPVNKAYSVNDEQVSLADGFPFLIIGQASLDDLNKRLDTPIPMNRFRPNFVFTGGEAFAEDGWKDFRIGNNRFTIAKPCARCTIPTVNQYTAETGKEPVRTLSTYRKQGNNIYFGQNVISLDHQKVVEGDEIVVQSFKPMN